MFRETPMASERLKAEDILQPFELKLTFEVGNSRHVVTVKMDSKTYYREFMEAMQRGMWNELNLFMNRICVRADPTATTLDPNSGA